jgi:hypothetical protein
MIPNERVEIRPNRLASALKFMLLLAFLVPACGYALIAAEGFIMKAVGGLGLLFFGGGGAVALLGIARTPWTLAFTRDALEVRVETIITRISWNDIEAVGLANVSGQKMPSLRLMTYDNYIASLSPDAVCVFEKRWGAMKWMAGATMALAGEARLADHASASSVADVMRANRALTSGYDISFAWNQLDRPAAKFVVFLEQEWMARRGR